MRKAMENYLMNFYSAKIHYLFKDTSTARELQKLEWEAVINVCVLMYWDRETRGENDN